MNIDNDFDEIMQYAHFWNWLPDWALVKEIYDEFPNSFSILTPFAYSYLEELIRSTTSEYGRQLLDNKGKPRRRRVGIKLIELAILENKTNFEYVKLLENMKSYFQVSCADDYGDNRNSVVHGYMHPRFWNKESFECLLHDIATLSKYANF